MAGIVTLTGGELFLHEANGNCTVFSDCVFYCYPLSFYTPQVNKLLS